MKNKFIKLKLISLLLYLFIFSYLCTSCSKIDIVANSSAIYWHEDFYQNLNSDILNLHDPMIVFDYIFRHIRENPSIYPSENYYYFTLVSNGHLIRGDLALQAATRDQGILSFDYYEVGATEPNSPFRHNLELNQKQGVLVKKLSNDNYSVSYKGKQVIFSLKSKNDMELYGKKLFDSESIIFNSNDESGLDFQMIYDDSNHHTYWVLNQRTINNETFETIQDNLLVGNRSQFVFYTLASQKKMILVGVFQSNVYRNEWYDGPFDQLADNAAYNGEFNLKQFYLRGLPRLRPELIDEYGFYKDGSRVATTPYMTYQNLGEIEKLIISCEKKWSSKEANFIKCITPLP